ncbi:MAG: 5'-nucleotidase C-terminal domain-containing protein [Deltaproteobacteria bacterium]|nr:5'-nucleotidase C-terminal domain-containing protein [Deltaproteobacteria bacterium]
MKRLFLPAFALVALFCGSCLSYNEDCAPLVDNPDETDGYVGGDIDITKVHVRSGDNAFGEVVADAWRHSADAVSGTTPADIGFENSGDIRNEGVCANNDTVPRGPLRRSTLRQVLPFDDTISLVTIDAATLKAVLEHSVAGFNDSFVGQAAQGTPPGQFLQMSGVTAIVDCHQPAASSSNPGSRVTRIVLQDAFNADGSDQPGATVIWDGTTLATQTVRVAVNSYVLTGGDGYTMMENLDATASKRFDLQGLNFQIAAEYLQKSYTKDSPIAATAKPRWILTNCAGSVSP